MEARQRVEVTSVLAGGTELASNVDLGGGAQRMGVGAARATLCAEGGWVARGGRR